MCTIRLRDARAATEVVVELHVGVEVEDKAARHSDDARLEDRLRDCRLGVDLQYAEGGQEVNSAMHS